MYIKRFVVSSFNKGASGVVYRDGDGHHARAVEVLYFIVTFGAKSL